MVLITICDLTDDNSYVLVTKGTEVLSNISELNTEEVIWITDTDGNDIGAFTADCFEKGEDYYG